MNKITFDGRLTRDSELRSLPSGDALLSFSVASDIGYGDKKQTNFFSCTKFGKGAEALASFLKKGQQVTVYGSLTVRQYTHSGAEKTSIDIKVDELSLQGGKKDVDNSDGMGNNEVPKQRSQRQAAAEIDDDIPF